MAVDEYSGSPPANTQINGIDIAEGCAPGNINNAIRQMMADIADGVVTYYGQGKSEQKRQTARNNIGLGNVDNTSDTNKPVSTATQSALNGKANNNDSRLTNAREWTASTVSAAEARAGTATTRRAWTAQRVAQAIRALAIGEGQAWQNVLANRTLNTWYQNTTGKTIAVSLMVEATGSFGCFVRSGSEGGGVRVTRGDGSSWANHYFLVPPGHFYRVSIAGGGQGIQYWSELR